MYAHKLNILALFLLAAVITSSLAARGPLRSFRALNKAVNKALGDRWADLDLALKVAVNLERKQAQSACIFPKSDLRPAVEALTFIRDARECSQDVLDTLKYISEGAYPVSGGRIVDLLAERHTGRFKNKCGPALELQYKAYTWQMKPEALGRLPGEFVNGATEKLFDGDADKLKEYLASPIGLEDSEVNWRIVELVYGNVRSLSEGDQTVAFGLPVVVRSAASGEQVEWSAADSKNFLRAFDKYVRKPCQTHNGFYRQVFDSLFALRSLYGQPADEFFQSTIEPRSQEFKDSLLVYKRCNVILRRRKSLLLKYVKEKSKCFK